MAGKKQEKFITLRAAFCMGLPVEQHKTAACKTKENLAL